MTDHDIEDIKWSVPNILPGITDLKNISSIEEYPEYVIIHFFTLEQIEINNLVDELNNRIELHILFQTLISSEIHSAYNLCIYTTPLDNYMYKIYFQIVNNKLKLLLVYKFSSIEVMLENLKDDLIQHLDDEIVIRKSSIKELIADFM